MGEQKNGYHKEERGGSSKEYCEVKKKG